jgi:hypothetical protein
MQPVVKDTHGVLRFRENAIIRYIVDHAAEVVHPGANAIDPNTSKPYHQGKLDLSKLITLDFPQEDHEQFAQLMGYSISGYHELSYVSDESCEQASTLAKAVIPEAGGCRDAGCAIHGGPLDGEAGKDMTAAEALLADLVGACSAPIEHEELLRLAEWASNTISEHVLLKLMREGKLEILVNKDGRLPTNPDDWNYRRRKAP